MTTQKEPNNWKTNEPIISHYGVQLWRNGKRTPDKLVKVELNGVSLNNMCNEACADERNNTELLKKVLSELIDAIAHYLSDDPKYKISTLTTAIINGQKALKKKYGVD